MISKNTQNRIIAGKRLLVANRGEIAIRIFRAASELNMTTVAVYSYADRFAMHRFKADEAYVLGRDDKPLEAYLDWPLIIQLAKEKKIDAIHPGYGFLSENAEFARACEESGIMFCGPSPEVLEKFGDKVKARRVAQEIGVPCIPGTQNPVATLAEAFEQASKIGYPVVLKAVSGGGGKGIRRIKDSSELSEAFERARSEAKTSFGSSEIYIEKSVENAKHIEIQIVGDSQGKVIHLFDRDCSIQRRNQKIIEIAPALNIPEATRERLFGHAVALGTHTKYVGVGTVEFLVDQNGQEYFLEVNPRIQVEHTVTEMVTHFDIVQASIMLSAGRELSHPVINVKAQSDIQCRGVAVQCRITTEDPKRDFAPDTGKILAYRPAQGFGIRLDEGMATSGGVVTPHYDSLLVKVTAHGVDMLGACNKMSRALSEFRIRGVRTNIPLLKNVIKNADFVAGKFTTGFLQEHSDVFDFPNPQDRATKILRFLADVTVNNPHKLSKKLEISHAEPRPPQALESRNKSEKAFEGAKEIFDRKGSKGLQEWLSKPKELLFTDTTMRDAHQSLFATRMRTKDIIAVADYYRRNLPQFFSLEVWGGATFDTSLRFLKEDPWERLAQIREKIPNVLLQMLLRGDNAVGYTNYPEWVIRDFIRLTVKNGLDVFRIFDCLNNSEQMSVAIDEVKNQGAIAEACVCYTGNLVDPKNNKYDLKYYLRVAKELENMGADILCIKDMAGLLRPEAARILVCALRDEVGLPIHLHTHATSGNSEAMIYEASRAGVSIVDAAMSSMSGLTSQPSLNAIVAGLEFDTRASSINLKHLNECSTYWESVRGLYAAFETNVKSTTTRVYEHEIPGGQYSNLFDQARQVGVSVDEFEEITERYKEVNILFGDIVKVTPSSKVIGDMALLLHKNKLTGPAWIASETKLDYPDSVVSFFMGHMGIPYGGFPQAVREKVLGKKPPAPAKPVVKDSDSFESLRTILKEQFGTALSDEQVMSYRLYPKVFKENYAHHRQYGNVDRLPTSAFFYGLQVGQEISMDLEEGKTLYISLSGISEPDDKGIRKVFFELNGFPREIELIDQNTKASTQQRPKIDLFNPKQIGAPMPGKIISVQIKKDEGVTQAQTLLVLEAMKMEVAITAKTSGKVANITVSVGDQVLEGDLLVSLE